MHKPMECSAAPDRCAKAAPCSRAAFSAALCGERMGVHYSQEHGKPVPTYICQETATRRGGKVCQSVPGKVVDPAVGALLVELMTPMTLDVTLERTRHDAELARRSYMKVDPANRLVADTIEAEWNEKLRLHTDVVEDYEQRAPEQAAALDAETQQRVRDLAEQLPRIWSDPRIDMSERKRIPRLLVADVTLVKAERIIANVRLSGGATRTLTLDRPLPIAQIRKFKPELVADVDRLLDRHCDREIADIFNERGLRSWEGKPFNSRRSPSSVGPTTCPAVASACGIVVCSSPRKWPNTSRSPRPRCINGGARAHHQSLQRQSQPWSAGYSFRPHDYQRPPGSERRSRPPCLNYRSINRTGLIMKHSTQRYLQMTPDLLEAASERFAPYAMEANHDG
ncbi:hypothetical protein ACFSQQ_37480 [Mesorhizobium kowhaii]|uniref:hypothetical protein n=1 Tax=Mesorhizobium kowhaii TaxID=1300272 RepID=UPI0035EEBA39